MDGQLHAASYSVYLWHWPLIVLAPFVVAADGPGIKVAILAFTILLAGLTKRLVEDPARTTPLLTRRPARRTFAAAARSRASRVHQPQPEEDGCATYDRRAAPVVAEEPRELDRPDPISVLAPGRRHRRVRRQRDAPRGRAGRRGIATTGHRLLDARRGRAGHRGGVAQHDDVAHRPGSALHALRYEDVST
jgi:hypothetical protein